VLSELSMIFRIASKTASYFEVVFVRTSNLAHNNWVGLVIICVGRYSIKFGWVRDVFTLGNSIPLWNRMLSVLRMVFAVSSKVSANLKIVLVRASNLTH